MNINDMLHLEVFASSKVLTAEIGLANEVDSVMVLEAVDIEKWGRPHQVILTSYYALSDLQQNELKDFLAKMAAIGSSALIVKMDRLITRIPDELITLCLELQLPLIKIEKDISYEKIVLAIYRPILNYQSHVLKTYYEVRQAFTKIEKNLPAFDRIMESFQELIKRDCQLQIPDKKIHVLLPADLPQQVVLSSTPLKNKEFTKNQYELLTLFSQQHAQENHALKTTIRHPAFNEVTLLVYENGRPFDDVDLMIIENVLDIINEKLQMEYLLKKDRYNRLNNLANALLEGTTFTEEEQAGLLNETKMDQHPYYQGIAISLADEQLLLQRKAVLNKLKLIAPAMIYHDHSNYLIALYNLKEKEQPITTDYLQQLLQPLFEAAPNAAWNIAVSQLKERALIHEILSECLDTMKFNTHFYIGRCLSIKDLGIFRHFIRGNHWHELQQLIPQELLELQQQQPNLLTTLASFLRNDKNYQRTADELFLHPKTVRYRINKTQQLLPADFDKPLNMLNYQIGIYLLDWQQNRRS